MISPCRFILIIALLLMIYTSCYAQEDGDALPNMNFGQNQACQPYSCPKPYVPLSKWPLGITSTGCQSNNGMMMAMGGTNTYKHLEQCCHLKQACYQLCGSNKQACDAELDKCMEKSCTELSDLTSDEASSMSADEKQKETEECNKMKGMVSLMNNIGGCNEYDMHQRRTCECIDKEKVVDKMERVLRNFYKKFNPDGVNKVKALVEKTDGKRAMFTKILYGLVKKYPDAIKKKVPDIIDPMKMDL